MKNNTFTHVIDLNERGSYRCHVEDANGKTVWQADNEESEDGTFWPVEDGFMRNTSDMLGLADYLVSLDIMTQDSRLVNQG